MLIFGSQLKIKNIAIIIDVLVDVASYELYMCIDLYILM